MPLANDASESKGEKDVKALVVQDVTRTLSELRYFNTRVNSEALFLQADTPVTSSPENFDGVVKNTLRKIFDSRIQVSQWDSDTEK